MREQFEKLPEIARSGKPRIVYGHGISDSLTSVKGVHVPEYKIWKAMMRRCYSEKYQESAKTYIGCSVSSEFIYFSKFKDWCQKQKGFGIVGFELDKDLLIKRNSVYSSEVCCFLPKEINSCLILQKNRRGVLPIGVYLNKKTNGYMARISSPDGMINLGTYKTISEAFGVYKNAKEGLLKKLAEKYKDLISTEAYKALCGYCVEIED